MKNTKGSAAFTAIIIVVILVAIAGGVWFVFRPQPMFKGYKGVECTEYVLSDDNKIIDENKKPRWIDGGVRSPEDGYLLQELPIIPANSDIVDSAWRSACYHKGKNIFWIVDKPEWREAGRADWYGPFNGKPCSSDIKGMRI